MVSILVPTSFDLHNLDPPSHCGQKVEIPQRFFTIMKCVFSYQRFLAPGPPVTISSNVIPMEYFSCSGLYCFVCCVCKLQRCEVAPFFTRPLLQKGSSLQEEILCVCVSVCVSVRNHFFLLRIFNNLMI